VLLEGGLSLVVHHSGVDESCPVHGQPYWVDVLHVGFAQQQQVFRHVENRKGCLEKICRWLPIGEFLLKVV